MLPSIPCNGLNVEDSVIRLIHELLSCIWLRTSGDVGMLLLRLEMSGFLGEVVDRCLMQGIITLSLQ